VTRRVVFRPEAAAEALETRDWYESRQPGLGAAFRKCLDDAIGRLAKEPSRFRRVSGETRRALLDRFPYAVYFRATSGGVVVLAVHGRQHPRNWQRRT
jgi:plasmid stabilization system protein ParE